MRFPFSMISGLLLMAAIPAARAQVARPSGPLALYQSYQYTGFTVFDTSSPDEPTTVRGVGGTLILRPNGTYEKHLSIVAPAGPHYFNQTGTFTLAGDSIRFAFTDLKGADVQRGTIQLDSTAQHLTLTILGYPAGNKGVYEVVAAPVPAATPALGPPRPERRQKRRP